MPRRYAFLWRYARLLQPCYGLLCRYDYCSLISNRLRLRKPAVYRYGCVSDCLTRFAAPKIPADDTSGLPYVCYYLRQQYACCRVDFHRLFLHGGLLRLIENTQIRAMWVASKSTAFLYTSLHTGLRLTPPPPFFGCGSRFSPLSGTSGPCCWPSLYGELPASCPFRELSSLFSLCLNFGLVCSARSLPLCKTLAPPNLFGDLRSAHALWRARSFREFLASLICV